MPMTRQAAWSMAMALALGLTGPRVPFAQVPPGLAPVKPVDFGAPFPPAKFSNLNRAEGQPASVDLASYLGKKPIVFVYWMAGNPRAEKILLDTQAAVDRAGADKVAFFPIAAAAYGSTDVSPIRERTAALKLKAPVLNDEGFRLLQQLNVHAVPNISIIDTEGKLRISNGGSLTQTLEYKLDLEGAIKRVATTGKLSTYGALAT